MKSKKLIIIISVSTALVLAGLAVVLILYFNSTSARLHRQLDLGNKYLQEQAYEEAIASFNKAIAIDPMNPDAYMGLAEAYIGTGDLETARDVLQDGIQRLASYSGDNAGDVEKLKEMLDEILGQLNVPVFAPEIITEVPGNTEEDTETNLPYFELPFGPGDFRIAGKSILDDFDFDGIVAALAQDLPDADDLDPQGWRDILYFEKSSVVNTITISNKGYIVAGIMPTSLLFSYPSGFGDPKPDFSLYPCPHVEVPEVLNNNTPAFSDIGFLATLRDAAGNRTYTNRYIFTSQYGKNTIYFEDFDDGGFYAHLEYAMDSNMYEILFEFESSSNLGMIDIMNKTLMNETPIT